MQDGPPHEWPGSATGRFAGTGRFESKRRSAGNTGEADIRPMHKETLP